MRQAAFLWWLSVFVVGIATTIAGASDWLLWLAGRKTITEYLRENPSSFWYPFCLLVAALALLVLHLFVFTPEE